MDSHEINLHYSLGQVSVFICIILHSSSLCKSLEGTGREEAVRHIKETDIFFKLKSTNVTEILFVFWFEMQQFTASKEETETIWLFKRQSVQTGQHFLTNQGSLWLYETNASEESFWTQTTGSRQGTFHPQANWLCSTGSPSISFIQGVVQGEHKPVQLLSSCGQNLPQVSLRMCRWHPSGPAAEDKGCPMEWCHFSLQIDCFLLPFKVHLISSTKVTFLRCGFQTLGYIRITWRVVKTKMTGPSPRIFDSVGIWWRHRNFISESSSDVKDVVGPRTTPWE